MSRSFSREYWSDSSDPHKCGPIRVTLCDEGLVLAWAGDARPVLALKPDQLMDMVAVAAAESDLAYLREEATAAVQAITDARDELRGMMQVLRVSSPPPRPVRSEAGELLGHLR